jgi:CRAL/TRIO domain
MLEQKQTDPVPCNSDPSGTSASIEDTWENVAFFIQYWNLSDQEAVNLLEVRDRLSDIQHPFNRPGPVVRFMRAREFHVDRSESVFREAVAWRSQNGVDSILKDWNPPQEILDSYPGAIIKGTDHCGDPIFVSRTGVTDLYGMVEKFGEEAMIRYEIYRREAAMEGAWVQEWERAAGRPIRHTVVIEDLKGLNMRHLAKKVTKFYGQVCDIDSKYYPETNKKIVIIRAPTVFRLVWSVVKHFFDPRVVSKMEFCGENYHDVLGKYMDLHVLPPCIFPEGKGEAVEGLPSRFEGGTVAY